MERCFVVSSVTQMVAGKADCSHCSIVSSNNSGVRLFWTSQLTSHYVIYWTGGALFSWWMAIDSRHQLNIITAATDLMETALGHSKTLRPWLGWGRHNFAQHTHKPALIYMHVHACKHRRPKKKNPVDTPFRFQCCQFLYSFYSCIETRCQKFSFILFSTWHRLDYGFVQIPSGWLTARVSCPVGPFVGKQCWCFQIFRLINYIFVSLFLFWPVITI